MEESVECYICDTMMEYKEIIYDNPKFGDISTRVMEKATAYVCPRCGEICFDADEAIRLQNIAMKY